ncbi:hypothetical protein [Prochlorothrix hollandica]|uniref:hypothetical protein n=1 Tax=Prochlorothrix hollandica TaxID=1223 RepID=UPI001CEDC62E|nr:hypothetical protein [Prochlorothrix hollandica]
MGEDPFPWGGFTDFGRGNPPVVAPAVGRQEGRHRGKNPTRSRWFQGAMHPVDPAPTGDRGADTLLTSSPLNSYFASRQALVSVRDKGLKPLV